MQPFKELLSKPMSRQEFLKFFGVGLLSIFGVSNFLSYFTHNQQHSHHSVAQTTTSSSHGFGSRSFGA